MFQPRQERELMYVRAGAPPAPGRPVAYGPHGWQSGSEQKLRIPGKAIPIDDIRQFESGAQPLGPSDSVSSVAMRKKVPMSSLDATPLTRPMQPGLRGGSAGRLPGAVSDEASSNPSIHSSPTPTLAYQKEMLVIEANPPGHGPGEPPPASELRPRRARMMSYKDQLMMEPDLSGRAAPEPALYPVALSGAAGTLAPTPPRLKPIDPAPTPPSGTINILTADPSAMASTYTFNASRRRSSGELAPLMHTRSEVQMFDSSLPFPHDSRGVAQHRTWEKRKHLRSLAGYITPDPLASRWQSEPSLRTSSDDVTSHLRRQSRLANAHRSVRLRSEGPQLFVTQEHGDPVEEGPAQGPVRAEAVLKKFTSSQRLRKTAAESKMHSVRMMAAFAPRLQSKFLNEIGISTGITPLTRYETQRGRGAGEGEGGDGLDEGEDELLRPDLLKAKFEPVWAASSWRQEMYPDEEMTNKLQELGEVYEDHDSDTGDDEFSSAPSSRGGGRVSSWKALQSKFTNDVDKIGLQMVRLVESAYQANTGMSGVSIAEKAEFDANLQALASTLMAKHDANFVATTLVEMGTKVACNALVVLASNPNFNMNRKSALTARKGVAGNNPHNANPTGKKTGNRHDEDQYRLEGPSFTGQQGAMLAAQALDMMPLNIAMDIIKEMDQAHAVVLLTRLRKDKQVPLIRAIENDATFVNVVTGVCHKASENVELLVNLFEEVEALDKLSNPVQTCAHVLTRLTMDGSTKLVGNVMKGLPYKVAADFLSLMKDSQVSKVLKEVDRYHAADILSQIPLTKVADMLVKVDIEMQMDMLNKMDEDLCAPICREMADSDLAELLKAMDADDSARILTALEDPGKGARVLALLTQVQAATIVGEIAVDDTAAAILAAAQPERTAEVFAHLEHSQACTVLCLMPNEKAATIADFMAADLASTLMFKLEDAPFAGQILSHMYDHGAIAKIILDLIEKQEAYCIEMVETMPIGLLTQVCCQMDYESVADLLELIATDVAADMFATMKTTLAVSVVSMLSHLTAAAIFEQCEPTYMALLACELQDNAFQNIAPHIDNAFLSRMMASMEPEVAAQALEAKTEDELPAVLSSVEPSILARVFSACPPNQCVDCLLSLDIGIAADVVDLMQLDAVLGFCPSMETAKVAEVLGEAEVGTAAEVLTGLECQLAASVMEAMEDDARLHIVQKLHEDMLSQTLQLMPFEISIKILSNMDIDQAVAIVTKMSTARMVHILRLMEIGMVVDIMNNMAVEQACQVITDTRLSQPRQIMEALDSQHAASILETLEPAQAAKLVARMDGKVFKRVMKLVSPEKAAAIVNAADKNRKQALRQSLIQLNNSNQPGDAEGKGKQGGGGGGNSNAKALLDNLAPAQVASIMNEMKTQDVAQYLRTCDAKRSQQILKSMDLVPFAQALGGLDLVRAFTFLKEVPAQNQAEVLSIMAEDNVQQAANLLHSMQKEAPAMVVQVVRAMDIGPASRIFSCLESAVAFEILREFEPGHMNKIVHNMQGHAVSGVLGYFDREKLLDVLVGLSGAQAFAIFVEMKSGDLQAICDVMKPLEFADMLSEMDKEHAAHILERLSDQQRAEVLNSMDRDKAADCIGALKYEIAATMLPMLESHQVAHILHSVNKKRASSIFSLMDSDYIADLLSRLDVEEAIDMLSAVSVKIAVRVLEKVDAAKCAQMIVPMDAHTCGKALALLNDAKRNEILAHCTPQERQLLEARINTGKAALVNEAQAMKDIEAKEQQMEDLKRSREEERQAHEIRLRISERKGAGVAAFGDVGAGWSYTKNLKKGKKKKPKPGQLADIGEEGNGQEEEEDDDDEDFRVPGTPPYRNSEDDKRMSLETQARIRSHFTSDELAAMREELPEHLQEEFDAFGKPGGEGLTGKHELVNGMLLYPDPMRLNIIMDDLDQAHRECLHAHICPYLTRVFRDVCPRYKNNRALRVIAQMSHDAASSEVRKRWLKVYNYAAHVARMRLATKRLYKVLNDSVAELRNFNRPNPTVVFAMAGLVLLTQGNVMNGFLVESWELPEHSIPQTWRGVKRCLILRGRASLSRKMDDLMKVLIVRDVSAEQRNCFYFWKRAMATVKSEAMKKSVLAAQRAFKWMRAVNELYELLYPEKERELVALDSLDQEDEYQEDDVFVEEHGLPAGGTWDSVRHVQHAANAFGGPRASAMARGGKPGGGSMGFGHPPAQQKPSREPSRAQTNAMQFLRERQGHAIGGAKMSVINKPPASGPARMRSQFPGAFAAKK